VYTDFGKWMDGWETRRRRSAGKILNIFSKSETSIFNFCLW